MKDSTFSVSVAIIIGSVLISISILISGGNLKFKGASGFKQTESSSPAPVAPAVQGQDKPFDANAEKQKLVQFASTLNLNSAQFQTCLENEKYKPQIDKDLQDAQAAGADGTPTFFIGKSSFDDKIDGVKLVGAQPYTAFKTIIDDQLSGSGQPQASGSGEIVKVALEGRPLLGDKNAPVTMIEFSDYECPFCKRYFQQTFSQIKKDYIDTGKVKLIYRNLPLSFHDPAATTEALAAYCTRDQGGDKVYFQYHDLLFENTKSNGSGVF